MIGVVSAVFYMKAFNKLGEKSGVDNFKTTGLLYLLGVVLAIVGVGVLLMWIAWILALIGFRAIKPKISETSTFASSTATPSMILADTSQKRYCPYCGAENIPGLYFIAGPAASHNNESRHNQKRICICFLGQIFLLNLVFIKNLISK